jgi:exopolyphosphatase/guanosine-5'-triphosphate,3'-diphosphate pyrophosphatase
VKIRVLELGSNSFQLHGFDVTTGGIVRPRWGFKRTVRLARGVSKDGILTADYAKAGIDAVEGLLADSVDDAPLTAVATSAVREAQNRDTLLQPLTDRFGIVARVLSGTDEAKTSFAGALASMETAAGRVAVVDIGGGSTEIAVGDSRGAEFTHSERVGTLAREEALKSFREEMGSVFARVIARRPERLIFASGSARALQRLLAAQGLLATGDSIPTAVLARMVPMLPAIPTEELVRLGVGADRQATLVPGARLVLDVAQALGASCFEVAQGGLREGVAIGEWRLQQSMRSIAQLGGEPESVRYLADHFARVGEPVELPRRALASGE